MKTIAAIAIAMLAPAAWISAQHSSANYDESKVPKYTLPDPLVMSNGKRVTDAATWRNQRRPEILRLFETQVYGKAPGPLNSMRFQLVSVDRHALGGRAIRKRVTVLFNGKQDGPQVHVLIYLPPAASKPVPAFLGLNFQGNHSITSDPGVPLSTSWMRSRRNSETVVNNRATEKARGVASSRWPVEMILNRGYALVTAYYGDIAPDDAHEFRKGVHSLFARPDRPLAPDEWGAISAWAWGLSRIMDYLETDRDIDSRHVAVMGHSRLGKTALWAGAQDERFAIVISNDSGCGGAALSRRRFGETVKRINTNFPHWFCANFKKYNDREDALPVDQHELIALSAPRPVYIGTAQDDLWADPRGMFLAAKAADPVYRLLGTDGLPVKKMPPVNHAVMGTIGFHMRTGKHDVTDFDWKCYLDFADKHFQRRGQ